MKFSVWPGTNQSWDDILDVARHAELAGYDRVYIADHFMPNTGADDRPEHDGDQDTNGALDGPMLECWGVVSALAAAVPRVGIGTLVCGNTYRHPAVLANQATTADVISGGRVILGLGAGWQVNEHLRYGIELYDVGRRMDRFEESCAIVRSLIDNPRTTHDGYHYRLINAPMEPKPAGAMPLLIGGGGEKRTLRIAATYAQEWNVWSTPEHFAHKSSVLDGHCDAIDRDPSTIHRSTQALLFMSDDEAWLDAKRDLDIGRHTVIGTPEQVVETLHAYAEAGVDEFIVPDFTLGTGARRVETLQRFMTEVAVHV